MLGAQGSHGQRGGCYLLRPSYAPLGFLVGGQAVVVALLHWALRHRRLLLDFEHAAGRTCQAPTQQPALPCHGLGFCEDELSELPD